MAAGQGGAFHGRLPDISVAFEDVPAYPLIVLRSSSASRQGMGGGGVGQAGVWARSSCGFMGRAGS